MSYRERRRLRVDDLPQSLHEACDELEKDEVICNALGDHITQQYLAAKRAEWNEYNQQVTAWEQARYPRGTSAEPGNPGCLQRLRGRSPTAPMM